MSSQTPITTSPRSRSSSPLLQVPPRSHLETLLALFLTTDEDKNGAGQEPIEDMDVDEMVVEGMNLSEQVVALHDASERLLHAIQSQADLNDAAMLIESDVAIVQLGPAQGSALPQSSRRLLTLIQNIANHPGSSVATDPAIVRISPSTRRVHGQAVADLSLGDREILRDVRDIQAAYREQAGRLMNIIRSLPLRAQDQEPAVTPQDPSIVQRGNAYQVSHEGQGPQDSC